MRRGWVGALAVAALGVGGCGPPGFKAEGWVGSAGGRLGSWRSRPQGCMRTGVGGLSLLWVNPVKRDVRLGNQNQYTAPDAPLRLDVAVGGRGTVAVLETVRTVGTRFDSESCGRFTLETREEGAEVAGGRATLGGRLRMDCGVDGAEFTADVRFSRCDY